MKCLFMISGDISAYDDFGHYGPVNHYMSISINAGYLLFVKCHIMKEIRHYAFQKCYFDHTVSSSENFNPQ